MILGNHQRSKKELERELIAGVKRLLRHIAQVKRTLEKILE